MKTAGMAVIGLAFLCAIAIYGVVRVKPNSVGAQGEQITIGRDSRINGYRSWHKVNQDRVLMEPLVATLCKVPKQYTSLNPHVSKYITVFVNEVGKAAMLSKDTVSFPVGSVIVKEKYSSLTGGQVELLTIMVKREQGFDSSVGDWEFLTADRENAIYKNVDLSHCISCHQREPETDFTFRSYLSPN